MQKTITDYTVSEDVHLPHLIVKVNKLIVNRYQPLGPIVSTVDLDGCGYSFYQAMVKYARTTRDDYLDDKLELALTAMSKALSEAQDTPTSSPDDQKIREILGSAIEDIFNQEVES
jgi:hypothetical protein